MNVSLISITQPLIKKVPENFRNPHTANDFHKLTPEEFIVYIARVSNPSNQMNTETGGKLIKYLVNHNHWSPFEHVSCTYEIKTSRAIAAQILRHRSFTFQEFSQRYSEAVDLEQIEWRKQGKTNRQVGDDVVKLPTHLQYAVEENRRNTMALYKQLIGEGIAKETARMILPLSTTTTIYMSGTVRSWIHYLELRCKPDTQKEHREIALEIAKSLRTHFPITFDTLESLKS